MRDNIVTKGKKARIVVSRWNQLSIATLQRRDCDRSTIWLCSRQTEVQVGGRKSQFVSNDDTDDDFAENPYHLSRSTVNHVTVSSNASSWVHHLNHAGGVSHRAEESAVVKLSMGGPSVLCNCDEVRLSP